MITQPAGWTLVVAADHLTLVPPEGAAAGAIRYVERVRPLRRLGDIVRQRLANYRGLVATEIGAPERLLTGEGEHAALVEVVGTVGGKPAKVTLGVVFVDDFYARIDGLALHPSLFDAMRAQVRELVVTDRH